MNIIVTGASKGIGYATAKLMANDKDNKVIVISRDGAKLEQLAGQAGAGNIIPIVFDLTGTAERYEAELKKAIAEHIERVDVLINNAGYLVNMPFEDLKEEDLEQVFGVNLFSIVKLTQILLPLMGGDRPSHIVNIGSMGGYHQSKKFVGLSAYSASKGAVATLSECMAEEFLEKHISVNCLALGAVQTEMLTKAFPGYEAPVQATEMAQYIAKFALKGMYEFNGQVIPVELG